MTEYHNQNKAFVVCPASPVENRPRMANPATFSPKIWGGFAIAALCLSGGLGSCSRTAQSPSTTETTTTTTTEPAVSPAPNSSPSPSTTETTPTPNPAVNSAPSSSSQMTLPTTKSPEIQTLARSIVKAQTAEIGQMQKWYQTWYKSNP